MVSNPPLEIQVQAYPGDCFFDFKDHKITAIVDRNDEPWFVAKEVCDLLELASARDSVRYLDSDEKSYVSRKHLGLRGGKPMLIVNEFGLYALVLGSRKKEAKEFKRWVTHEVLPAIRKTGSYTHPAACKETNDLALPVIADAIKRLVADALPDPREPQ